MKIILKNVNYLDSEKLTLERGNIFLDRGKISKITKDYEKRIDADDIFPADNYIVFPGLINAHTHPSKILYQGSYSCQPLVNILDTVKRNNQLEDSDIQYTASLYSLFNAVKYGVTTSGIFTSRPLPDIFAAKKIGIRSNICFSQNDIFFEQGKYKTIADKEDLIENYNTIADRYEDFKTIISPATASELSASDEYINCLLNISSARKRRFFMHLHEGKNTVKSYQNAVGCSAIENFNNKKLLLQHTTFIHLSYMTKKDVSLIKDSGCAIVHCPSSNMFVGSDIMPLNSLIQNHSIGFGTDAAMINPLDSLTFESFLSLNLYSNLKKTSNISVKSIWNMLTVDGAKALGFNNVGVIKPDYLADLIFFDKNILSYPYINTPLSLLSLLHNEKPQKIMINGEFINMENLYKSLFNSVTIDKLEKLRQLMLF